jgi:aminoglycoside/choline kinase family phosphotransferase
MSKRGDKEYLKDVPRVLGYIEQVLERNSELKKIQELINEAEILN